MPTITRKIELHISKDGLSVEEYRTQWQYLRQINDNLYMAANRVSSHCFLNDEYEHRLCLNIPEYLDIEKRLKDSKKSKLSKAELGQLNKRKKELEVSAKERFQEEFGKSSLYTVISNEFGEIIPGQILTCLRQYVQSKYNKAKEEQEKGKRVISTYKKGMPIPFPKRDSIRLQKQGDDFVLKWYNKIFFKLHFGRDRSNNRVIVERLIQSELNKRPKGEDYVMNNSSIQLVEKDKMTKLFLLLSVDIPAQKRALDSELVLGVDLGLNFPLYYATNKNAYIRGHIGDRDSFFKERMVFQRRFKELQRLQCTQGGRGRKKKLEPLEKLREKEANRVRTKNHIFSREIIKTAIKFGAGVIHLEDLQNFGKDINGNVEDGKKFVLRYWSYSELQTLIEYKAKMEGITVKYVNPAYTSQTCSCCGERGERNEQAVFRCLNPVCPEYMKEINADYNAARNIAKSKEFVKRK